ncbi:leukocyte surface antigen CD53 [Drosophila grimshawi]|nr:leukocyte surface antigen CD53 [Drosophila grimshawi]XP_032589810.1 leukocyte surface antigen CD53 [Drosophila grimshawi]XP_032589811.1 leukocyte surface antigen CD53 [Drosophila grimshawi]
MMALPKKIKCFKYLVYSYVFLLALTGAAQIFLGTSLLWGHSVYYGIVQNKLWAPAAILLCLGPVTFILCWMGCQATNQRKRCLLGMFAALLVACICVQFIICGWSLAMRENLPTSVEIFIDDSFVEFLDKFSRTKVDNLHLWNRMQSQLQCCGVDGPLDYRRLSLPWSCCSRPEHAYESACDTHYKRGCLAVVSEQIKSRLMITAFGAAIIAILQSLGIFCAVHLTILFGKNDNTHPMNMNRKKKQQQFLPLTIQDKRHDLPSPINLSPSAPGQRVLKTALPSAMHK